MQTFVGRWRSDILLLGLTPRIPPKTTCITEDPSIVPSGLPQICNMVSSILFHVRNQEKKGNCVISEMALIVDSDLKLLPHDYMSLFLLL